MSGIFKAVKKTIKKIGKVIKKIAPYLLIAAAVYFGGAYLMSSGAATAGAAGSVGTSFTKAGGVWKAFLSGMGNGTASQSAAAFAEASYQTSIGANPLPLSGQVAAGTSAVNALSNMGGTADAVKAGVDFARNSWNQAGGNPQGGWNIILNGLNKTQTVIKKAATSGVSPANAVWGGTTADSNAVSLMMEEDAPGGGPSGLITQSGYEARRTTADIPRNVVAQSTDPGLTVQDIPTEQINLSSAGQGGTVASKALTGSEMMYGQTNKLMEVMLQGQADSRAYNQQILADRNRIATQQMWMQGTGMLLSAIGASGDTLEEKKDKRKMAWKPSGKEEYASGAGKMYPGGIIS